MHLAISVQKSSEHHTPASSPSGRYAWARIAAHVAALVALGSAIAVPALAGADPGPAAAPTVAAPRYALPLPGRAHVVRPFEQPPAPWAAGHRGVDLSAVPGADVLSPTDGVVTFAGRVAGRPLVTVSDASGRRSTLEPVVPDVVAGDHVQRGDVLGALAPQGGHCTSPCLHWGVRVGASNPPRYVDPMRLVAGDSPIVLLPDDGPRAVGLAKPAAGSGTQKIRGSRSGSELRLPRR